MQSPENPLSQPKLQQFKDVNALPNGCLTPGKCLLLKSKMKEKEQKKKLAGYKSPDSCCKRKSLITNAAFLPKSF